MKVRIPDSLKLPAQAAVEHELLKLLSARSRPLETREAYRILADTFMLTSAQRDGRAEGSSDPAWNWLVRRAMQRLQANGFAARSQRGFWTATDMGKKLQKARDQYGPKCVGVVLEDIFDNC